MFRTEYGRDLKNPFVNGNERLFIKLGRLRKIYLLAEIIKLKDVRAALCAREVDLRGMNFGEALFR